MNWLLVLLGLALLTAGAELLVRGASQLALALRVSPLIVGLTVVAWGTSAPEMVVSLQSSLSGNSEISLGNVVGSNIVNVLLILGLSAIIVPLVVAQQLIWFDVPLMVAVSLLVQWMAADGRISRGEGGVLFFLLGLYTLAMILASRRDAAAVAASVDSASAAPAAGIRALSWHAVTVVLGLGLLVLGSSLFLKGAIAIARELNVSELVIGLTLVATGTSLPELATSVLAAWRGERDIAVGNIVGSNIFNILAVLGLSAVVVRDGVGVAPSAISFDIPFMNAVAIACLPICFTGHCIARWEGALFLAYWLLYIAFQVLTGTGSELSHPFTVVLTLVIIPLTAVTLLVGVVRALRSKKPGG